ncbi:protein timeless [Pieris rapae]|uniref:protein timeless n=1 Tax=Pieris rapae TaxID=64459 RepID=UPI001E27CAC1|nr:protein timeless [Pieris rapae]XP_022123072.2 protein timeless [Pieris rapae]XP_045487567.1 protein timeless [Pieris rapae]
MEWVLRGPQIHSTFSKLGFAHGEGYHINENCNVALESILNNILTEDKNLRTYRRSISFGQNIKKDLIPLLIHVKDDKTIELLIKILVNLTIPVECLLSVESLSTSEVGKHTIFEINSLLTSTKAAFVDNKATKVIVEFLKKNSDCEQKLKLTVEQCTNISNTLLFLRNILHIPEDIIISSSYNGPPHVLQNQIIWNLFSQSIDKTLMRLMNIQDSINWGVTMVQLIALLYKNQNVTTIHKLLNMWLGTSLSESSEDNESNTSPPNRGSGDSSPMLTSEPISDYSDMGGSGKTNEGSISPNNSWDSNINMSEPIFQSEPMQEKSGHILNIGQRENSCDENIKGEILKAEEETDNKNFDKPINDEKSNCSYDEKIDNQESTSSNDDELPSKKPVHQKPHNPKQKPNNNVLSSVTPQESKRKKIVKRGKANIINVQGLLHNMPTDDDISNVIKEFTVDFLLKGYNSLVRTLHTQILTNVHLEIDTSHFFWLVTYFLKFATQIELDLEYVDSVLSFDIVLYLTAEGVNLCEQFELALKLDGCDLKPNIRRLHLVVTAIREFVQAIEVYKKSSHISQEDKEALVKLQMKMCETDELRSLLVLLLRHYNPKYQSKQYLQDLVVTNHILLMFLDTVINLPDYKGSGKMIDYLRQFATPQVMYQYGLLLDDYMGNGEYVNDCIFTLMHYVGGELGCLISLFQPKILKTFTSIWKSDFEICDDWSDLIEYVINTFIKKPYSLQRTASFRLDTESFDDDKILKDLIENPKEDTTEDQVMLDVEETDIWTEDELSAFSWIYIQSNTSPDVVGEIIKRFKDEGVVKTRESVIKQLYKQSIIQRNVFENLLKQDTETKNTKTETRDVKNDDIGKICEYITKDGKKKFLDWVQNVLLETCYAKLCLEKKKAKQDEEEVAEDKVGFYTTPKKPKDMPVMSPVSYHALLFNRSVPLVPWNCEQAEICKDLKFLQLLHKLGFYMPVDTGKMFIRIPYFWTPDYLYEVASKISYIDKVKLKFSLSDISNTSDLKTSKTSVRLDDQPQDRVLKVMPKNFFQIDKQKHIAGIVKYSPIETTSAGWLQLVQKSQEIRLTVDLDRKIIHTESETVVEEIKHPYGIPMVQDGELTEAVADSRKEDPVTYSQAESEYCCNSMCETASVASDLTRMYVSDEDEKSEIVLRPSGDKHFNDDQNSIDIDSGAGKRARVHYTSPFC